MSARRADLGAAARVAAGIRTGARAIFDGHDLYDPATWRVGALRVAIASAAGLATG